MKILRTLGYWLPIVLLALPMIIAGGAKLAGVPELHKSFEAMGLPIWFGYLIGVAELIAGILLFIKGYRAFAALALTPIMTGAIYFHIVYAVPSFIPALIFLLLAAYLAYRSRPDAKWLANQAVQS